MAYHYPTCDVLVVGSTNDVFRLDLSQGRFVTPFETDMQEINVSLLQIHLLSKTLSLLDVYHKPSSSIVRFRGCE
jgi:hypothetical protein